MGWDGMGWGGGLRTGVTNTVRSVGFDGFAEFGQVGFGVLESILAEGLLKGNPMTERMCWLK